MFTLKGRRFYENHDQEETQAAVDNVAGPNVRLHWNCFTGDCME
jgi:hypothetical protein